MHTCISSNLESLYWFPGKCCRRKEWFLSAASILSDCFGFDSGSDCGSDSADSDCGSGSDSADSGFCSGSGSDSDSDSGYSLYYPPKVHYGCPQG